MWLTSKQKKLTGKEEKKQAVFTCCYQVEQPALASPCPGLWKYIFPLPDCFLIIHTYMFQIITQSLGLDKDNQSKNKVSFLIDDICLFVYL